MIVGWLDNTNKEITDKLIEESFIKYVLESSVKQGPEYSISTYPNWIEDLDEDYPEHEEAIKAKLQSKWIEFQALTLNAINKYMQNVKPIDFHGRKVTLDGRQYTTTKVHLFKSKGDDPEKYGKMKVTRKKKSQITKKQRNELLIELKQEKAKELDEQVAKKEILEYQPIDDWEYIEKENKLTFWFLLPFDSEGTVGKFLDKKWVSDWVGFDWDNQEKMQQRIGESQQLSDYFAGRDKLKDDDPKAEDAKSITEKYFEDTILTVKVNKKDPDKFFTSESKTNPITMEFDYEMLGDKEGAKKYFEESGAGEFAEFSIKNTNVKRKTEKWINWGKGPTSEGPIRFDNRKDYTNKMSSPALAKKWLEDEIVPYIHKTLTTHKFAFNPLYVNMINVNGVISDVYIDPDADQYEAVMDLKIDVTTFAKVEILGENLPKEAPTTSAIGRGAGQTNAKESIGFKMQSQFKTYIYNPVRRTWANHVAARLRRLDEVI